MFRRILAAALLTSLPAFAQTPAVRNVVLVHGAWADGSSWQKVIPLLEARGLHVVAVQNPLTSFAEDVAATRRTIDAQDGPVILVGHSYGGAVITEAGNDPKVAGIVYVAAFAMEKGETVATTDKDFPTPPARGEIRPLAGGFLVLTPKGVHEDFCQDLPTPERNLLLAAQGATSAGIFTASVDDPAWHHKPTFYVVAANDRTINPDYERKVAKRMNATTITVQSSHVAMLAQPKAVADLILKAASK